MAKEVVDARKVRIDEDQAWTLLKSAKSVTTAKGKKVQRFEQGSAEKEVILQQVMGPSGNLRAPCYRAGDDFIIGFNAELYADWLK